MSELVGIAVLLAFLWLGLSDLFARGGKPVICVPIDPALPVPKKPVQTTPLKTAPRVFVPPADLPNDILNKIAGLANRSLDDLQRQWLNTISMIDRVGPEKAAPFIAFRKAISAEWARRLAAAEADNRAFPWPTTKAPKGKSGLDSGDWHLIGMLSYLGYRVGKTNGVTQGVRHQILDLCFSGAVPPINGLDYMRGWGLPGTTDRLRKLANEIASFARNGKRKRAANLEHAVADWEADLSYLYRRYYVGKFSFTWPRID